MAIQTATVTKIAREDWKEMIYTQANDASILIVIAVVDFETMVATLDNVQLISIASDIVQKYRAWILGKG